MNESTDEVRAEASEAQAAAWPPANLPSSFLDVASLNEALAAREATDQSARAALRDELARVGVVIGGANASRSASLAASEALRERTTARLGAVTAAIESARATRTNLEAEDRTTQETITGITTALHQNDALHAELLSERGRLQTASVAEHESGDRLTREAAQLEVSLRQYRGERAASERRGNETSEQITLDITTGGQAIRALENERTLLEKQIAAEQGRQADTANDATAVEAALASAREEQSSLMRLRIELSQVETVSGMAAALPLADAATLGTTAATSLSRLNDILSEAIDERGRLGEEAVDLRTRTEAAIASLDRVIANFRTEREGLLARGSAIGRSIELLKADVVRTELSRNAAQDERERLERKLAESRATTAREIEQIEISIANTNIARERTASELSRSQANGTALKASLEATEIKLRTLRAERETLERSLSGARATLDLLRSDIIHLESAIVAGLGEVERLHRVHEEMGKVISVADGTVAVSAPITRAATEPTVEEAPDRDAPIQLPTTSSAEVSSKGWSLRRRR